MADDVDDGLSQEHLMGGDCLNVGCVPSKALIRAARVAHEARHAADFGISVGDVKVDFGKVRVAQLSTSPRLSCESESCGLLWRTGGGGVPHAPSMCASTSPPFIGPPRASVSQE